MSFVNTFNLKVLGDERGQLFVMEGEKNLPFDIKRVYYLTGTKLGVSRGFHAHKQLEQVAVCVSGSCRMLMDNGREQREFLLDSPDKAILIGKMIWHEMHDFSEDCVLLVLADDYYDESDYIRNYNDFKALL
ncbi:FdtA/QdtA family cupin domain-containing protein [uncultured Pseudomonas sp.]|jgi:dTDP-4-dehydrorhamnose 3,5-epimerase-like enzyme|uniref:sugar 3,4-ketoisomerase n=1 Tax=uncultured Pseudomonas sp. TaxID=114707 RepID=UPI00259141F2|nr:FdtA/QdtA family cupin domain-containing protein [uncultured Pseudomonas sp.]